jgi:DNA (cytosine-5)-methyltransferase 1
MGYDWHDYYLKDFAAIHASPVCKAYTQCNLSPKEKYPRLIAPIRERLQESQLPYVIENVMGAKDEMRANLMLCGTMFGLPTQRHRLFEIAGIDIPLAPASCNHQDASIAVHGHSVWDSAIQGTRRKDGRGRPDSVPLSVGRAAMDINWMTQKELAQAIPPAYTAWIGRQLREEVVA